MLELNSAWSLGCGVTRSKKVVFCKLENGRNRGERTSFTFDWEIDEKPFNVLKLMSKVPQWADALKEHNMPNRRAYYSNDNWLRHRSSLRHFRHMASMLSSRVIISLIPPVFTVTGISTLVTVYNLVVLSGWLPAFFPLLHGPSLPYELTAPALALLLVFRTDTSYSRYDEARKTWTEVISSTKNLARHSMLWVKETKVREDLLQFTVAFPIALKCHLLAGSSVEQDLKTVLDDRHLKFLLSSNHRPNCIIQLIFHSINSATSLSDTQKSSMNESISIFNLSISICERLIRTPIPLSYTRLTSRFLIVWHLALPIVLWDDCNWLVIPSTFFSAAALFCIEEVGVLIEEPFPMLALDRLCQMARIHTQEMVELRDKVQEHLALEDTVTVANGSAK